MNIQNNKKIITSREFHAGKRRLITIEQQNYHQIILLSRAGEKTEDKNWYEIADHSALIYYYEVCRPLHETVNFSSDTDSYYEKYQTGLICMNGLKRIKLLIKKSGLYQNEKQNGIFHIFNLNQTFTESHLRDLIEREQSRRRNNNQIIPISFSDPELYIRLRNIAENLHRICNSHFDKLSSFTTGQRLVILSDHILNNYQILSQIKNSYPHHKLKLWRIIYQDTRKLSFEIQTAIAIKVMSSSDGTLICSDLKFALIKITSYYATLAKTLKQEDI